MIDKDDDFDKVLLNAMTIVALTNTYFIVKKQWTVWLKLLLDWNHFQRPIMNLQTILEYRHQKNDSGLSTKMQDLNLRFFTQLYDGWKSAAISKLACSFTTLRCSCTAFTLEIDPDIGHIVAFQILDIKAHFRPWNGFNIYRTFQSWVL